MTRLSRRAVGLSSAARAVVGAPAAPAVVLLAGMALVAVLAAKVGVRVQAWSLDETVLKQSAVHYTAGLPGTLLHDLNARGTARAYSLLLSPFFRAEDGADALRWARAFNAVMFVSAAVPAFLLSRMVLRSRWSAVLVGLGSIVVPWLTITTLIFTENLAYPLVVWTAWAAVRALSAPTRWRDALVLALIVVAACTRVQLALLLPAYVLAILVVGLDVRRGPAWAVRRATSEYPFTSAVTAVGLLGVAYLAATNGLHARVNSVLGSYGEIQDRQRVAPDVARGAVVEMVSLAIGVGVVPALVATTWIPSALRRTTDPAARRFAAVAATFVVVALLPVVYLQNGYLGENTEERYYFYAAPFLLLAALAAYERRELRPARVLTAGLVLAMLVASVGLPGRLDTERPVLAPVNAIVGVKLNDWLPHLPVAGVTGGDALFVIVLVLAIAAASAWAIAPRARWLPIIAVPAVVQLALCVGAVQLVQDGHPPAIKPRVGTEQRAFSWVDRANTDPAGVAFVANQRQEGDGFGARLQQRDLLFWNDEVTGWSWDSGLGLPQADFPLSALTLGSVRVTPDGVVQSGVRPGGQVVQVPDSPFIQVAGQRVAVGPTRDLELVRTDVPPRVRWRMTGLSADGTLAPGVTAQVFSAPNTRATLVLAGTGAATLEQRRRGHAVLRRRVVFAGEPTQRVALDICRAGTLTAPRAPVVVVAAELRPATPAGHRAC